MSKALGAPPQVVPATKSHYERLKRDFEKRRRELAEVTGQPVKPFREEVTRTVKIGGEEVVRTYDRHLYYAGDDKAENEESGPVHFERPDENDQYEEGGYTDMEITKRQIDQVVQDTTRLVERNPSLTGGRMPAVSTSADEVGMEVRGVATMNPVDASEFVDRVREQDGDPPLVNDLRLVTPQQKPHLINTIPYREFHLLLNAYKTRHVRQRTFLPMAQFDREMAEHGAVVKALSCMKNHLTVRYSFKLSTKFAAMLHVTLDLKVDKAKSANKTPEEVVALMATENRDVEVLSYFWTVHDYDSVYGTKKA